MDVKPCYSAWGVQPLTWIGPIVDSPPCLALTALATEMPQPQLLEQRPYGRSEPLINKSMATHILVQAAYQVSPMPLQLLCSEAVAADPAAAAAERQ